MAFMSVVLLASILMTGGSTADNSLGRSVNTTDLASDECMTLEEWMEIPHVTDEELEALKQAGVKLVTPSYVVPDCLDLQVYREELKRKESSVNSTDLASDECMSLEEWMEIPHVTDEELEALGLVISELATPSYIAPPCPDLQLYREEKKKKEEEKTKMNEVKDTTPLSSTTPTETVECEETPHSDATSENDIGSEKITPLRAKRSTR